MTTRWIDTILKWREAKRSALSTVHPVESPASNEAENGEGGGEPGAGDISTRFATENIHSPEYDKIKELETFNYYDELWIQRTMKHSDKGNHNNPNCYEITSPSGQPIFKVMQKFDQISHSSESCQSLKKTALKLCIFDMRNGNEILTLTSKPGSNSVLVCARQKFFQYNGIGKIIRIEAGTAWRGPDYNVRGANGKLAIKVNGNRCFFYKNTAFDICTPDNKECYGKIHKDCEGYDPKDNNNMEAKIPVYRINFPLELSMVSKALILSTALTMDLDYFECGEREAKSDFLLFSVGLAMVTLIVLLFVIILSILVTSKVSSYINSHYGNQTTPLDEEGAHYTAPTEFDEFELFVETTTPHIK